MTLNHEVFPGLNDGVSVSLVLTTGIGSKAHIGIIRVQAAISTIRDAILVDIVGINHLDQSRKSSVFVATVLLNGIVAANFDVEWTGEELATDRLDGCVNSFGFQVNGGFPSGDV